MVLLLLVGSKHVLEEVELSLCDGDQHQKGPQGLTKIMQHHESADCNFIAKCQGIKEG